MNLFDKYSDSVPDVLLRIVIDTDTHSMAQNTSWPGIEYEIPYFACSLDVGDLKLDCRIILGHKRLTQGLIYEVPALLLSPELKERYLSIGTKFKLWNGSAFGSGQVAALANVENQVLGPI